MTYYTDLLLFIWFIALSLGDPLTIWICGVWLLIIPSLEDEDDALDFYMRFSTLSFSSSSSWSSRRSLSICFCSYSYFSFSLYSLNLCDDSEWSWTRPGELMSACDFSGSFSLDWGTEQITICFSLYYIIYFSYLGILLSEPYFFLTLFNFPGELFLECGLLLDL